MENSELSTATAATLAPESALDGVNPALAATPDPMGAIASADEIPDKLYFRIGDVAKLAGIKPYVLRFWETEFPGLGPKKSGTNQRQYRRKDGARLRQPPKDRGEGGDGQRQRGRIADQVAADLTHPLVLAPAHRISPGR